MNYAVKNVQYYIRNHEMCKLRSNYDTPMKTTSQHELNTNPAINPTEASYYMSLIGILRWVVELVRGDIFWELSMMSSHMELDRK